MRPILLWILLLLPPALFSQAITQPALLKELSSATDDRERAKILNGLAFVNYESSKPDAGLSYGTQALELANKLQWKEAIWDAKAVIGLCHEAKEEYDAAKDFLQPIIDTANIPANKKLYIYGLRWLCNYHNFYKDYAKVIAYARHLLALRRVYDTREHVAYTLMFIGNTYLQLNAPGKAFPYWTESAAAIGDAPASDWINVHQNIGMVYFLRKDETNSLSHFEKALALSRKWGLDSNAAENLKSIARVHHELKKDYSAAELYYGQALALYEKTGDRYLAAVVLNNIAGTYAERGLYPQALSHYLKSLRISEGLGKDELLATVYNDMALVYFRNLKPKEAIGYFSKAKAGFEKIGWASHLATVHSNLGTAYLAVGDTANALKYIQVGLKAKPGSATPEAEKAAQNIGILQSSQGNYAEALASFTQSLQSSKSAGDSDLTARSLLLLGKSHWEMALLKDRKRLPDSLRALSERQLLDKALAYLNESLGYFSRKKMLAELQENHRLLAEVQKGRGDAMAAFDHFTKYVMFRDSVFNLQGATEMAQMRIQYEFDKKEAQAAARTRTWIVGGIGLVLLLAMGFFFYRYREVSRFRSQMAGLRQQALNAQMSDHFIGNTMDSINGFIQHNEKEKAGDYLNTFSRLIRNVLENASQKTVLLSEDLDVLRSYLDLEALRFAEGAFSYEIAVDENVDAENVLVPPMVFQVLAENGIKHGLSKTAGGCIGINVTKKGNVMECSVEDNGIGRAASAVSKEGQKQQRQSFGSSLAERLVRSGSKGKGSVSFGIDDLVDESDQPQGTRVRFTLPYLPAD